MLKVLAAALKDIELYKKRYDAYQLLSASAQTILSCFKEHPEVRLTRSTLVKEQFIQRYGKGSAVRYQLIF